MVLSNSGHDHLRNSVVLLRKNVAQFKRGRSKRLSHLLFIAPRGMNFGRFARRPFDGGSASCEHVSTTYGVEPVRGYWRSGEERHQSRIRLCADLTADTAPHTGVLVSSPHGISNLFKEQSHLHGSSNASSDSAHTRCKSTTRDPVSGVLLVSG